MYPFGSRISPFPHAPTPNPMIFCKVLDLLMDENLFNHDVMPLTIILNHMLIYTTWLKSWCRMLIVGLVVHYRMATVPNDILSRCSRNTSTQFYASHFH